MREIVKYIIKIAQILYKVITSIISYGIQFQNVLFLPLYSYLETTTTTTTTTTKKSTTTIVTTTKTTTIATTIATNPETIFETTMKSKEDQNSGFSV